MTAHQTFLSRLDHLARATGLYRLTLIERPRPRRLRVIPALILAAMPVGYGLMIAGTARPISPLAAIVGSALFFGAFLAAMMVRFFGPRLVPAGDAALDEREIMLKARAGSISGAVIATLAIGGCFYMGVAGPFGLWRPTAVQEWIWLALLIEGAAFALPVLVASWLEPRDPGEDPVG